MPFFIHERFGKFQLSSVSASDKVIIASYFISLFFFFSKVLVCKFSGRIFRDLFLETDSQVFGPLPP